MPRHALLPRADRGPLKAMFLITSMPVGGAETLLLNLIRRVDRTRILPHLGCMKELGPLGEELAREIPVADHLLHGKYDVGVLRRLPKLLRGLRIDAVITVGAGDKMFWGRLAARRANVPVVLAALHSTGWPDGVGRLNRWLTPLTDGFIGVARPHGQFLVDFERFPPEKVFVIPNGVDIERFQPRPEFRTAIRAALNIPQGTPLVGIVAALRPEKNHALFLQAAALVKKNLPAAHFLIVGDGPERARIESRRAELGLEACVHLLGTRSDTPQLLAACDAFALTSHNEANPVSILESLATGVPVVATHVGSVPETVIPGETGFLAPPGDAEQIAGHLLHLLKDRALAQRLGQTGRAHVVRAWSLDAMVTGYTELIEAIYERKAQPHAGRPLPASSVLTPPAACPAPVTMSDSLS